MARQHIKNDALVTAEALSMAALSNVPIVGSTITTIMGVYGTKYMQRRVDTLAEELDATMKRVEDKVDRAFLETDEWAALVMRVVRDSMQTTDRKKVRYLAAILAGTAMADGLDRSEAETMLNALSQLTAADMVLARALMDRLGHRVNPLEADNLPNVVPNPYFHAARLEAAGFIGRSESTGMRFQPAPYMPTPILRHLMGVIDELVAD
jgi:hypothetical protein